MLDKSLFISDTIHAKDIELADGKKHTLHFKELPAGEFRRFALANDSDDEKTQMDSMPRLIAASLVDAKGKKAITTEQARMLKVGPMVAIFTAIQEVNSNQPKKTAPGDSGTP